MSETKPLLQRLDEEEPSEAIDDAMLEITRLQEENERLRKELADVYEVLEDKRRLK